MMHKLYAGCTNETMKECLEDQVFGLPRAHWCYVQACDLFQAMFRMLAKKHNPRFSAFCHSISPVNVSHLQGASSLTPLQ